jgi:hypothetical protein
MLMSGCISHLCLTYMKKSTNLLPIYPCIAQMECFSLVSGKAFVLKFGLSMPEVWWSMETQWGVWLGWKNDGMLLIIMSICVELCTTDPWNCVFPCTTRAPGVHTYCASQIIECSLGLHIVCLFESWHGVSHCSQCHGIMNMYSSNRTADMQGSYYLVIIARLCIASILLKQYHKKKITSTGHLQWLYWWSFATLSYYLKVRVLHCHFHIHFSYTL